MKYIKVLWIHNFQTEPVVLYSELDDQRYEIRKVEGFRDGTCIAEDGQFIPSEITKEEFEKIWLNASPTGKSIKN